MQATHFPQILFACLELLVGSPNQAYGKLFVPGSIIHAHKLLEVLKNFDGEVFCVFCAGQ